MACSWSRSTATRWPRSDRAPSWASVPHWQAVFARRRSGRRRAPGSPRRARNCSLLSPSTVWRRCTGARPKSRAQRRPTDAGIRKSLAPRAPGSPWCCDGSLDLDLGSLLFEGDLDLVGLVARDAFLDGLRRRIDQILGLLEAEAGQLADDLDDRDLVGADLGEDSAELGLLFDRGGGAAGIATTAGGGRGSDSDGRGGCDAVALLELLDELGQLEHGHLVDGLEQVVLGNRGSHGYLLDRCGVRV